ncbi:olfactory receptor 14J1 [Sigmodon hispidus]
MNVSFKSGFLLMGFSDERRLQILHAVLFLITYLLAIMGNVLIITVITLDHRLHSPMYYFLKHLSFLDLCFISVTVPQSIANSLMDNGFISLGQCMVQVFFFIALASSEVAILTVMSYDRYVAICRPLQYETIMDPHACKRAMIAVWMAGGLSGLIHTGVNFSIPLCGQRIIHQFFCDIPQMLKLACSYEFINEIAVAAFTTSIAFVCLISIMLSYSQIFSTVMRIPSSDGRTKLQSPMYYFLKHLSFLDISSLSVTVPQSIGNSLMDNDYISYGQCILQVFFFTSLAAAEVAILTVMSYDRYVAICLPLHYEVIMNPRKCMWAVTAVWISGGISGILYTASTFSITFCRVKIIHQFFCDVPQLLKLSCSNDYLGVMGLAALMAVMAFACFVAVILSYGQIFSTILRMPSAEGVCAHLKSTSDSPTVLDVLLSIFYTVLPPTLNPVIYSLRNEAMKTALRKALLGEQFTGKKFVFTL